MRVPPSEGGDLVSELATYLKDHLAGARGGMHLFWRTADHFRGTARGDILNELALEVAEDLEHLRDIMADLDIAENRLLSTSAVIAERLGRLKPNGRMLRRSPLTYLVEIEGLRAAVKAKQSGWEALLSAAEVNARLPADRLATLKERAEQQDARLREIHLEVAQEVLDSHATS